MKIGDRVRKRNEEEVFTISGMDSYKTLGLVQIVDDHGFHYLEDAEELIVIEETGARTLDKGTTPGYKSDKGKLEWSLIPFKALEGAVKVLMFGAAKYSRDNWKKGMVWLRPLDAALRHIFAFIAGEDLDPETGLCHLDHAIAELLFVKHYFMNPEYSHLDDRKEPK